jgi:nicotinamide-nucleotide amidase
LTGGLISSLLTAAPGTSVTFRGGLVVYATDLKESLAGVSRRALEEHGPVHAAIAEQLAAGARQRLEADYGLGATGVAGPGEQGGREPGEVFIAVASHEGLWTKHYEFEGNRDEVRIVTVVTALSDLVALLERTGTSRQGGR